MGDSEEIFRLNKYVRMENLSLEPKKVNCVDRGFVEFPWR